MQRELGNLFNCCLKLSNSGDSLKLQVPNLIRNNISGWTNHSCMVTSQKMKETEIGYRGSKSIMQNLIVKEQRVDGSWCIKSKFQHLRCTLKVFERNYPIRILSKPRLRLNIPLSTVQPQKTSLQRFFYTAISKFQPKPNRGLVINPL